MGVGVDGSKGCWMERAFVGRQGGAMSWTKLALETNSVAVPTIGDSYLTEIWVGRGMERKSFSGTPKSVGDVLYGVTEIRGASRTN